MSSADRQYFLVMVNVREHALVRKLTYEEACRLCLDLFCPNDFLAQSLSVWRKNLDQVRGQGRNGWRQCCNIEGCVTT